MHGRAMPARVLPARVLPARVLAVLVLPSLLLSVALALPARADEPGTPNAASSPQLGEAAYLLLLRAREAAAAGSAERAADLIESALEIEPRNPWLWHRLAVLRLQQGHLRDAIALAQRSYSLAGDSERLREGNLEVIRQASEGSAPP